MIQNAEIDQKLLSLAETDYKAFNEKLIPTNYEIRGIRIPALRKLAKELSKNPEIEGYLKNATFTTYEHVLIYGLTLANLRKLPLEIVFGYLDPLIQKFDNWAHVDVLTSDFTIFKKYPEEVLTHYLPLKNDEGEFTKRFFVILLLCFYMDEKNIDTTLQHLSGVPQGQYYVDMAIAWTLSVGLVKFYDKTLSYLEQRCFTKFVHNKAIQKARESYRITPETKEFLSAMKIK